MTNIPEPGHFQALYEISRVINSIQSTEALLERVMDIAMEHLSAERGFLLMHVSGKEGESDFTVRVAQNIAKESVKDEKQVSTSVVTTVLSRGEAVLSSNALDDSRFDDSRSIVVQQIRSVACVPLRIREKLIGAIYVDSRTSIGRFTQESLEFLSAFANLAAIALENVRLYENLQAENKQLRNEVQRMYSFEGIVGKSKAIREVLSLVTRVVDTDISVLILGESGTGKELIARAIHYNGRRKAKPFVAVNCAAIPETLLESELFGHKKGSFTGAVADKKGLFESANEGTIFLDEIADISPAMQAKILRVLQEREIRRVGDNDSHRIDVRVTSATNKDMMKEVKEGRFREDLYYRLNVLPIHIPPLRERRDDIPLLAEYFLRRACALHGRGITSISASAMEKLLGYPWPGNARELENTIERATVLAQHSEILPEDFGLPQYTARDLFESGMTLQEFERRLVEKTLEEVGGNRTHAAERLGVSVRWIHYRLKEWQSEDQ
jgi:Nif-specific regulatory protein